ncbi:regulation of nuclear pre-mRNA domain-containing protein 2 [Elysia marginata]|uniref:Regulation of nuclear pre-mRNA domain-containing protein 2 n=1 Tax=Elysia marginata TaxID=1093978 RepID=A0AAV4IYC9_9GAST|nr:regulation of nuclear pre-mRNA domain-containing protein 2 [Elysia marginata]
MAAVLNEESVEKKLKTVNNTQDSIQGMSLWIIHHKTHHERICQLWMKVLKKTVHPSHRLTLFYLCNDVVQTCKKKKAYVYNTTFKEHLREAACLVRDLTVKKKVERIFNIWQERGVYDATFVKSLHDALNGKSGKTKTHKVKKSPVQEEIYNGPISPVDSPVLADNAGKQTSPQPPAQNVEDDEEESARILAEFKPHEMIEQISAFTRQATDIKFKLSQITHLKLDMSSAEAVKRLKDRAHGNDFSNQFEDSCNKLAELVKRQTQHVDDQRLLLQTLNTSETFYEEQYREAKIVANAYKNFGARINNMKKKLDELKRTFPQPDSPIPSPDVNAPSPGNTPPHLGSAAYAYSSSGLEGNLKPAWYNGARLSAANVVQPDQDVYDASPPLEAPSPEDSPPDLNLGGTDSASLSLESRLASFFDQGRSGSSTSNPPVYTPQLPASLAAAKLSSKQVTSTATIEEDGSTTPLDDEAPTTPVQDEALSSPPPPPKPIQRSSPPKKENPIDFLSRLISQTQKGPQGAGAGPAKTGAASFLDSLTMLNTSTAAKKPENPVGTVAPSSQPLWNAWSADSSSLSSSTSPNTISSSSNTASFNQPSSPSMPGYVPPPIGATSAGSSLPTSPVQFPSNPQAVPPPPIPLPVPPPPMALKLNLNMPPPPPPPFLTSPVPPPNFTSPPPPPMFQQTSPGQKENWPDVSGVTRLQTLQSDKLEPVHPAASHLADPDAMEIVSDEDEASLGIDSSTIRTAGSAGAGGDAKTEFANKLRQKTLGGAIDVDAGLPKSHAFMPNPERPNLMTLTVPDDVDENMLNKEVGLEDDSSASWKKSSLSRKSRSHSRSRSRSREKERSHKHKKKKKHKRNHSDDEDFRLADDGKSSSYGVGSVVKKVSSRSSRDSRDSKGDKYDDDKRYDKYDERKYDRYDDKGYRGEHKSYKSSHKADGGGGLLRDSKDGVEAYTQAYRDALFQQYSARFNPFSGPTGSLPSRAPDPRRYNKY